MGVSTKLYLHPKWELDDIITVLERTQNAKVEVKSHHETSLGFFDLNVGNRQIATFVNSNSIPIGIFTELHLSADEQAHKIFRDLAEVLCGLFQPYNTNETYEVICSKLSDDDAMPYFVKYAILHDGVDPDDLKGILKSIKKWHDEIPNTKQDAIYQQIKELGI